MPSKKLFSSAKTPRLFVRGFLIPVLLGTTLLSAAEEPVYPKDEVSDILNRDIPYGSR